MGRRILGTLLCCCFLGVAAFGSGTPWLKSFVHVATAQNVSGHITYIDSAWTNGQAGALLLVTPNMSPGGREASPDKHPIGVYYDKGQWTIFNQDFAPMPVGAAFNVLVLEDGGPGRGTSVVEASEVKVHDDGVMILDGLTDGNASAMVLVTSNWSVRGLYNNHYTGVRYDYESAHWYVFNEDGAKMELASPGWNTGVAFNAALIQSRENSAQWAFVHSALPGNTSQDKTMTLIDNPLTNNNPCAIIFVTNNYDARPGNAVRVNAPVAVVYSTTEGKWGIETTDGSTGQLGTSLLWAAFNVLVSR